MILETIIAFIATFGFGIIFNIKGKKLFFAAFGGALSWFVYSLCLNLGLTEISSLFLSSVIFSTYSEIFARILKTPVTTLVVCALIPLVPGGGMYYTMFEAVTGDINKSLALGLNTISSAGVLALGIIFVSTITKLIMSHKRKIEIKNLGQNL
ncbi:threonine/serine exporter family protein [Clostridium gasigenes]|uniref:Uncharacterized membrane protein YjjB, DUF3815 family n=1 Tax=Clostridium gasigenes TaxID=94869 RepID=A0A1H0UDW8_9CLOT|nr:threonine/serine exporter family protein [Clostridium gasigenes]MBB6621914.1 threonine/serine exporter family protein [Clostridium gasigenes]MBU3089764.1 threonine/serine exporter family protein [Clostridium gasigenes]MBU3131387.1 threonine/serine exporter family protein [Clostridium gasigenes]NKF08400.1 threonine/serine exporter [Clostridium gasigenes]QSW18635.1 threonine/serine exporter family protein [Clostridium gasigenes]